MKSTWLRDYQNDALLKMKNGCILNGGVGSGKSRTSIAYYYKENGGKVYYFKHNDKNDKYDIGPFESGSNLMSYTCNVSLLKQPKNLYIITTARKRDSDEWEGELNEFLMSADPKHNLQRNKVVIDSWNNIQHYIEIKDAFFIFDEQRVSGYGVWVKSFLTITKHNKWILLSATPGDKWEDYIPVFIANGFYRNKTEFYNRHVVLAPYVKFRKIAKYINTGYLNKLRNDILIDMDFKRNTVQHHIDVLCNYDKEAYKYITKEKWNIYESKPIENAGEYCLCLRRLIATDNDRKIKLVDIVIDHPKAIIFYNYDYELLLLRELFSDYPKAEWNGHKHEEIPDSNYWVYLVQYTAGCEGWNCVLTDTIIFYSPNYSYRVMVQASGRIDRLNTPFIDLYYYHLVSNSRIDMSIKLALDHKKKFNERKWAPEFEPSNKDNECI